MAEYCDNFRFQDADNDSFEFWNGLRGPAGPAGPAGAPGSSVELRGPVASTSELPASAPSSELWMVGEESPYDGYFWNGIAWIDAGQLMQGPQGEPGEDGADGTDGKSAYESAQDGGYSGTEQQFYTDLAEVGDKLDLSGGTMTGALNMGSHKITNVLDGTDDSDAVNLGQVSGMISTNTAYFRGSFATKAALLAVAWQTSDPSAAYYVTNNDYAIVEDDETQNDECWRYVYVSGTGWAAQYKINETPLTPAQIAALNSGATSTNISAIADKLDKTGDGKDVTVTFSAAASRTAIATGEKLSVLFGKILKWLSDLGTAAFRAATSSITSGSTDLIESGAVYTGLAGKAASDLGVSGATANQYVQITAVDANGKPTAFGPGTPSGGDVTADMLGIVINGNSTPVGASVGQYVIVKNSTISGITDGLYTAAQAIPANTAIDSTYLTAVSGGGLNDLISRESLTVTRNTANFLFESWTQVFAERIGNLVYVRVYGFKPLQDIPAGTTLTLITISGVKSKLRINSPIMSNDGTVQGRCGIDTDANYVYAASMVADNTYRYVSFSFPV